jgi:hypothetical protein
VRNFIIMKSRRDAQFDPNWHPFKVQATQVTVGKPVLGRSRSAEEERLVL